MYRPLLLVIPLTFFAVLLFNTPKPELTFGAITASSTTYSTAGTFNYTVSTNACQVIVDAWGGGGSGFDGSNSGGGAGGGGGAFASSTLDVTPGTNYTLVVGAGGVGSSNNGATSTFNSTTVVAPPGGGGKSITTAFGLGGIVGLAVGDVTAGGGNGGQGNNGDDGGGGGGGAGGPLGVGGAGADASATAGGGGGEGNGGAAGSGTTGGTGGPGGDGGNGGNGGVCTAGGSAATGGGGGGGADQAGTVCAGGAPGGGGGGAETTGPWNGATGRIVLTEFVNSNGCSAPPAVTTTNPATSITAISATIGGNITDAGTPAATARGFATGTVSTLASSVSTSTESSAGFGTGAWTAGYSNTSLTGNTTYYFRAYTTNTSATAFGSIVSFLTLPDVPTSLSLGSITTSAITASWNAPTGGADTYNLERCQTGTQTCALTTGIGGTSQQATGLSSGTSYDFAVQAVNTTGAGAWTATTSATTLLPTIPVIKSGRIINNSGTLIVK